MYVSDADFLRMPIAIKLHDLQLDYVLNRRTTNPNFFQLHISRLSVWVEDPSSTNRSVCDRGHLHRAGNWQSGPTRVFRYGVEIHQGTPHKQRPPNIFRQLSLRQVSGKYKINLPTFFSGLVVNSCKKISWFKHTLAVSKWRWVSHH